MRNTAEPVCGKYVKAYGFLSFERKFGEKYGKTLMDATKKTGMDAAKNASKRVVTKTTEATGDWIGNKIACKITLLRKTKSKEKEDETKKIPEIYIPRERRLQAIGELKLF